MDIIKENNASEFIRLQKQLEVYRIHGINIVLHPRDKKAVAHCRRLVIQYKNWFTRIEFRDSLRDLNFLLSLELK